MYSGHLIIIMTAIQTGQLTSNKEDGIFRCKAVPKIILKVFQIHTKKRNI